MAQVKVNPLVGAQEKVNPRVGAQAKVKNACDKLGLEPAVYELLKEPQRLIEISITVEAESFRGLHQ